LPHPKNRLRCEGACLRLNSDGRRPATSSRHGLGHRGSDGTGAIAEMEALDALLERVACLPADHPDVLAYTQRFRAHHARAVAFAQAIQRAFDARYN
jgi:hypothetical protein